MNAAHWTRDLDGWYYASGGAERCRVTPTVHHVGVMRTEVYRDGRWALACADVEVQIGTPPYGGRRWPAR